MHCQESKIICAVRSGMLLSICCLILAAYASVSCVSAQEGATAARKTIRKEFAPPQNQSGAAVVVTYDAATYDSPIELAPIEQNAWNRSTPESSYRGLWTAYKQGNAEWILRGMTPEERERKRDLVNNRETLAKNTAVYGSIDRQFILQKIFYGDYVILRIASKSRSDRGTFDQDIVYKQTTEGWLFTNELAEDPFVAYVLAALPRPALPQDRSVFPKR